MNRRTLLVIVFAVISAYYTQAKEKKDRMIMSEFTITSTEIDPNLGEYHAQFELNFANYLNHSGSLPIIELSCNGVIERFQLDSTLKKNITVSPGKYIFQIAMSGGFQEISTDSLSIDPSTKIAASVYFIADQQTISNDKPRRRSRRWRRRHQMLAKKPVLYFYAPQDQAVAIKLTPKGQFTYTYPTYTNGWEGKVEANGGITIADQHYPYLFWEGVDNTIGELANYSTGFVVKQVAVTSFLEDKLNQMGFNDNEKTDFITFWAPIMTQSEQGFVQFIFNKDYDQIANLSITPAPKAIFRVYMLWTPLEKSTSFEPQPQTIESMDRTGFYVIEWGGSALPEIKKVSL